MPKQVHKSQESLEKNGNISTIEEDPSSNESGIDETEFKTTREESEKLFARQGSETKIPFSFQDLLESLSSKKIARTDSVSDVELDSVTNRLHLKTDRSNIRTRFGYDAGRQAFLYPEEALYLLEIGKIEIFSHHLSLSVQRARSRLLLPQRSRNADKIAHCTVDEYHVYKDLTSKNYCLYRHRQNDILENLTNASGSNQLSAGSHLDSVRMDEDIFIEENACEKGSETDDVVEIEPSCDNGSSYSKHGVKRKHTPSMSEEEMSDLTDEVMEDFTEVPDSDGVTYLVNTSSDRFDSHTEPGGYTVDEADSDIEIVEELIYSHGGVEIQEIGHSSGYQEDLMEESEPTPSTSRGLPPPTQVVDLVSSEDDEEDLRSFGNKIWSKFIPNSKLYMKVPPPSLVPSSIPSTEKIYEYDLKDKGDMSDLELEFLVDEVSLNDEIYNDSPLSTAENWKEWRRNIFREARDVMNDSLLASSDYINGAAAEEKLFLWEDEKFEASCPSKIVFEVYGAHTLGFSRLTAFEGKPTYYVSILREDETIPDLKSFGSSVDGVPIINAIVCDSGEIVYMKGDSSPLHSLF